MCLPQLQMFIGSSQNGFIAFRKWIWTQYNTNVCHRIVMSQNSTIILPLVCLKIFTRFSQFCHLCRAMRVFVPLKSFKQHYIVNVNVATTFVSELKFPPNNYCWCHFKFKISDLNNRREWSSLMIIYLPIICKLKIAHATTVTSLALAISSSPESNTINQFLRT